MIFESAVLFASGFISSIYGALSGGAAVLTVPVMILLGLGPAAAVATNRFVIFLQGLTRLPYVYGKLNVGLKVPAVIIAFHTIGAIAGALILVSIEESLSLPILGIILLTGAAFTWFSPKGIERKGQKEITGKSLAVSSVLMALIGVYRGFFGPASGTMSRLVFVHFLGLNFTQTFALTSYSTFAASVVTLAIYLNAGLVNFAFGLPLAVGAIVGVVLGTNFILNKGETFMKNAFVALTVIFGVYFILSGVLK